MSTEEQAKHGFSITAQIRECEALVAGAPSLAFVDEGVSGEILQRPALTKLREQIEAGQIKKVVCLDPDRLSRKLLHQLLLTEEWEGQGVDLKFVNGNYAKTPEGNLFYALRGAISEFEKAKITERMCRGRREKARQGRVLRDFQIYGYNFDPATEQLVINQDEAAVVRIIFQLFLAPPPDVRGISGIAEFLTAKKIPTKRGASRWHRQVVRQILSNRTYLGEFYQNKWDTTGPKVRLRPREEWILIPCPQIIAEDIFKQTQMLLAQSRRRYAGEVSNFLLSGLLRCSRCGCTLKGKTGKHSYYQENEAGCGTRIAKTKIEQVVWEWCRQILGIEQGEINWQVQKKLIRMLVKEIEIIGETEIIITTF